MRWCWPSVSPYCGEFEPPPPHGPTDALLAGGLAIIVCTMTITVAQWRNKYAIACRLCACVYAFVTRAPQPAPPPQQQQQQQDEVLALRAENVLLKEEIVRLRGRVVVQAALALVTRAPYHA
ncbi:hypothetical protein LA080_010013 [Diaporthe eres]|nr:hypothetical protein LA080_010013 [Diaporthe eres]